MAQYLKFGSEVIQINDINYIQLIANNNKRRLSLSYSSFCKTNEGVYWYFVEENVHDDPKS